MKRNLIGLKMQISRFIPGGPGGPSMMPVGNCPSLLIVCVYPLSPLSPLSPASPEEDKKKLNMS